MNFYHKLVNCLHGGGPVHSPPLLQVLHGVVPQVPVEGQCHPHPPNRGGTERLSGSPADPALQALRLRSPLRRHSTLGSFILPFIHSFIHSTGLFPVPAGPGSTRVLG